METISEALLEKVRAWLGYDGCSFFQMCKDEYGTVSPVWSIGLNRKMGTAKYVHPVHFREGMQVRNFMRSSGLCPDWTDHDYDNNWTSVIEEVLKCIHLGEKQ